MSLIDLLPTLAVVALVDCRTDPAIPAKELTREMEQRLRLILDMQRAGQQAEHRVDKLLG